MLHNKYQSDNYLHYKKFKYYKHSVKIFTIRDTKWLVEVKEIQCKVRVILVNTTNGSKLSLLPFKLIHKCIYVHAYQDAQLRGQVK